MAEWLNYELVVIGPLGEVRKFRAAALRPGGHLHGYRYGDAGDLRVGRTRAIPALRLCEQTFDFQIGFNGRTRNPDEHFQEMSERFPRCHFIVASSDACESGNTSRLLHNGKPSRAHWMSARKQQALCKRARFDPTADGDFDFYGCSVADGYILDALVDFWRTRLRKQLSRRAAGMAGRTTRRSNLRVSHAR